MKGYPTNPRSEWNRSDIAQFYDQQARDEARAAAVWGNGRMCDQSRAAACQIRVLHFRKCAKAFAAKAQGRTQ